MSPVDLGIPTQPKLRNSPLRLALCQLRFPSLFGLEGSEVRPFAKILANDYPNASEDQLLSQQIEISLAGVRHQGGQPEVAYRFENAEQSWMVTLTREWLTLETTTYEGFPSFAERWHKLLLSAKEHLGIERESRLGLRYVNELAMGPSVSPADLQRVLTPQVLGPI